MNAATLVKSDAVEGFLFEEARLLDEGRFEDWLALFDPEAIYWVPAVRDQASPHDHVSIVYEDRPLLAMRVARLAHPRAYTVEAMPRATRVVSNVSARETDNGLVEAEAAFVMAEHVGGDSRVFSGRLRYRLRPEGDGFKILLKRVDLSNCDDVHGLIRIPL